ncbi:hypothetical protein C1Y63_06430 [Corynebacterium sp. 13CS0277]|uniref:hypothetical protein n=1 Tax=Corynebacterium sp. 13CS0277 TaxID=2071994 RepID=UPI000D027FD4|nr:hypothetical protein [Corynebacterium sp. 13CS0277]PRQ11342.1 hypothetical protein C1Y63_06430 [Corynebacterium sp. 13CS0277]
MDAAANPFRATHMTPPHTFLGRTAALKVCEDAFRGHDQGPILAVSGPRGSGLSSLLGELHRRAKDAGWAVHACTPAGPHTPGSDLPATADALHTALNPTPGAGTGRGVLLTVDDVHHLRRRARDEILAAAHALRLSGTPSVLVFAGRSGTIDTLRTQNDSLLLRGTRRYRLGPLTEDDARTLLQQVAADSPIPFTEDAARIVAELAQGHPRFLQLAGQLAWDAAAEEGATTIDAALARAVTLSAATTLGDSAYSLDIHRLPQQQQRFLHAMADIATAQTLPEQTYPLAGARITDIAAHLGAQVTDLSGIRARLLARDLIAAPARGLLVFTLPVMDAWLRGRTQPEVIH